MPCTPYSTHHNACDCREEAHAKEVADLKAEVERLKHDNSDLLAMADANALMLTQVGRERDLAEARGMERAVEMTCRNLRVRALEESRRNPPPPAAKEPDWTAAARSAGWLSPDGVQRLREQLGELRKTICFEYEQVLVAERAQAAAMREALDKIALASSECIEAQTGWKEPHRAVTNAHDAFKWSTAALASGAGSRLLAELHARRVLDEEHHCGCPRWRNRYQFKCTCGLSARQAAARATLKEMGK